jgi:transposase
VGFALRRRHRDPRAPARGRGQKRGPTYNPAAEALGRSQGGFSTKIHLRAEGGGKPLTFLITAGQRHEQSAVRPLLEQGAVKRAGRGRPRLRPRRVAGDKGYASPSVRAYLRRRGIGAVIPRKKDERRASRLDRTAYRERNRIERAINRLKQYRRIATRYEKRAANYLGMLTLATILSWL